MKRSYLLLLLGIALAAAFPSVVQNQYVLRLAVMAGLFILLASAHNLLMKVGQLSLGPVAFYGIGAYTSAILTTRYGMPFPVGFACAGLVAAGAGWVIGRLTLRMRKSYFVLVTIAFAEFFRQVALNWTDLTNGPMGITAVPPPAAWFRGYQVYYYGVLILVMLVLFGLHRMEHSTIGRAMQAIRQNESLAQSVGINSYRYMMLAAVLSSLITGLAGSYYAHFFQFVGPEILAFDLTITIVVMVIAGGRATLAGPVVGAVLFTVLPELLRTTTMWRMAIYGLLLMLIMLGMPDGIMPALQALARRVLARLRGQRAPTGQVVVAADCGTAGTTPLAQPDSGTPRRFHFSRDADACAPPAGEGDGNTPVPLLEIEHLCVYFGGVHAVEDVSFCVYPGEILAIIGPNGAGKTTVLNAVTRFGPITSGDIRHRGASLKLLRSHLVARRGIVRTFQHTSLFPDVATLRNLELGHNAQEPEGIVPNLLHTPQWRRSRQDAGECAEELLAYMRLADHAEHVAKGLPYGNQRLLEVGIALSAKPDILLLDEPAAGMNAAEVAEVMKLIRGIRDQGLTVVLVEHDMKLVMGISDRIVVLDHGKQIAVGRPDSIRGDERVVEAYLGRRKSHARIAQP